MKKGFPFFILLAFLFSCNKDEKNDLVWEKYSGTGAAYFIKATVDSGFITGGTTNGNPYLARYDRFKDRIIEITPASNGMFSDVWFDNESYLAAGSSQGKLLLTRFDTDGNQKWELTLDTTTNIETAFLNYDRNGLFLLTSSPESDSLDDGDTGLLFLRFDTAGTIRQRKLFTGSGYISASATETDNSGNIYLALTRKMPGAKSRASVAKFNPDLNLLWETELFNNPSFSSSCLSVRISMDKLYVCGMTEVPSSQGTFKNSFVASLDLNGRISGGWDDKIYPELSNAGSDLEFDKGDRLVMLNKNCMMLNYINSSDGTIISSVRTFSVCIPENTTVRGLDMDINFDGNLLISGSIDGKFYNTVKAAL